jgi:hypothetical protein
MDLKYDAPEKTAKNVYPDLSPVNSAVKKHADCMSCGMCEGDSCSNSSKNNINIGDNIFRIVKDNKEDLESLIAVIVKNVIEKTN